MKNHGIPVARYLGRGSNGTTKPKKEHETVNEGVRTPSAVRWLGRAIDVRSRYVNGAVEASSVFLAVLGEATFSQFPKSGLRLVGCNARSPKER